MFTTIKNALRTAKEKIRSFFKGIWNFFFGGSMKPQEIDITEEDVISFISEDTNQPKVIDIFMESIAQEADNFQQNPVTEEEFNEAIAQTLAGNLEDATARASVNGGNLNVTAIKSLSGTRIMQLVLLYAPMATLATAPTLAATTDDLFKS